MRSRFAAVVFAGLVLAGLVAPGLEATCAVSTPMFHGLDSYFLCGDLTPSGAFAYQQGNPAGTNTGAVEIHCVAEGGSHCFGPASGFPGDGRVTIETDWASAGIVGCPIVPSPQRVNIVMSSGGFLSGSALIVSLSGADPDLGYLVEGAHPYDAEAGAILPLSCGRTVTLVSSGLGHVNLRFAHPPIYTDCDPDSAGSQFFTACRDAFSPALSFGQVYTLTRPCSERVEVRREFWTATGVVPAADGSAAIDVDQSAPGFCTLIGSTTVVNGVETGSITGFVMSDVDCTEFDGDGYTTCEGDCDDHNAAVHPGATETCNSIDDNCDGRIDEGIDQDADTVPDCRDNCPTTANITQADHDGDSVGDVCDNCLEVFNPEQTDTDLDGFGDICDVCPTIPDPTQDPCQCDACQAPSVTISFSSVLGKGSGLVTWSTFREIDLVGFNIVEITNQGKRVQLNMALIRCEECATGLGHTYTSIIPKHKSGRNIFLEMLRINGTVATFGPAVRVP